MADLAQAKRAAIAHVDATAERARLMWITPGAGQSLVYALKREEAARFADDPDPDPAAYPMLSAEVGITAETIGEVAAVVAATSNMWIAIAAAIETLRLSAKAAIAAAETAEDAWQAARVVWPTTD